MCYIVYQKTGKLADASEQFTKARLEGRMEDAVAIYRSVTGDTSPVDLTSTWWACNASEVIKRYPKLDPRDVRKARATTHTEQQFAQKICQLATKKYGGEWDYYYEY